jgi:uncharacterized protein (DUF169 family)
VTHGYLPIAQAATSSDVAELIDARWLEASAFADLPVVREAPASIVYGPLAAVDREPDVVLIRLLPAALMTIMDAVGPIAVEGKPQCHIVAIAKEGRRIAASVGCALSRARTGMGLDELTCAVPGSLLPALVNDLEAAATANATVARYAGDDAARFAGESR